MRDMDVNKFLSTVYGDSFKTPHEKTAAEVWLEKSAGILAGDSKATEKVTKSTENTTENTTEIAAEKTPEKEPEKTADVNAETAKKLSGMSVEELYKLYKKVTPEEKTEEKPEEKVAGTEESEEMTSEQAIDILKNITALDMYNALDTDQTKIAEDLTEEDKMDLSKVTAYDYLIALGTELEKDASEEYEEIDLNKISAQEFLAGVESGEIVLPELEKDASEGEYEEIDLSKISAQEFIAGVESGEIIVPELEKEASDVTGEAEETSTSDDLGDVAYTFGRIAAQGIKDELNESEDLEKEAGKVSSALAKLRGMGQKGKRMLATEARLIANKPPARLQGAAKYKPEAVSAARKRLALAGLGATAAGAGPAGYVAGRKKGK